MIVAERKPFDEIAGLVAPYHKVLVLGCGSCVTVCLTGGEQQAEVLASQLRLAARRAGRDVRIDSDCITRQCDREFLDEFERDPAEYDAILSIACGVGVGLLSEIIEGVPVLPGLDTTFYGASTAPGEWVEYCHGCGDCVLGWTGGICPVARCAKSLINGTCGGTTGDGKCEVDRETDCAWHLIYRRLETTGRLDELRTPRPPRRWNRNRSGGVRRLTHEALAAIEGEDAE